MSDCNDSRICTVAGAPPVELNVDGRRMLEETWADVSPELVRLASALGIKPDRVEDIVQDVFHVAWNRGIDGRTPEDIRRWLIRVTINRCNLFHRREQRWRKVWVGLADLRYKLLSFRRGTQGNRATQDDREVIAQALDDLPRHQRSVLVLRYFKEYDSTVIGNILGMPPSTVRSHLRKARKALGVKLRELGLDDE